MANANANADADADADAGAAVHTRQSLEARWGKDEVDSLFATNKLASADEAGNLLASAKINNEARRLRELLADARIASGDHLSQLLRSDKLADTNQLHALLRTTTPSAELITLLGRGEIVDGAQLLDLLKRVPAADLPALLEAPKLRSAADLSRLLATPGLDRAALTTMLAAPKLVDSEQLLMLLALGEPAAVLAALSANSNDSVEEQLFQLLFAGSRKPAAHYLDGIGDQQRGARAKLNQLIYSIGHRAVRRLVINLHPSQIKSMLRTLDDDATAKLRRLAAMSDETLASLREVNEDWIRTVLHTITTVVPQQMTRLQVPPARIDQTTQNPGYANHIVVEFNNGKAKRNLIFDAHGVCVAEINFDNHGGSASSGHAHIYPVPAMPISGHHISGTPHFGRDEYPDSWRELPPDLTPNTALWN